MKASLKKRFDSDLTTRTGLTFRQAGISTGKLDLISDLNLTLSRGERLLLLGPNGSGKSTLLSVILGIQKARSGHFESTFRRIGYVPQWKKVEFQYPLTVEKLLSLSFPFPALSLKQARERTERTDHILELVQMHQRKHRLLRECSGGELQRAFLARAFLGNPDLLILDEPISAVDQTGRDQILDYLRKYCDSKDPAVIMTIHENEPGLKGFFNRTARIIDHHLVEEERKHDARK